MVITMSEMVKCLDSAGEFSGIYGARVFGDVVHGYWTLNISMEGERIARRSTQPRSRACEGSERER